MAANSLDSTAMLARLLDDETPRANPPRPQDAARMQDRGAEYMPLASPFTIYTDSKVAQPVCSTAGEAARFVPEVVEAGLMQGIVDGVQQAHNKCVENEKNKVPSAPKNMVLFNPRGRHAVGQVMHYFDSLYVDHSS
jgi:hypothetical protein